jgi:hypothetical protein
LFKYLSWRLGCEVLGKERMRNFMWEGRDAGSRNTVGFYTTSK